MANVKISELSAKGANLEDDDLLIISDYNGTTYDTKKITGLQIKNSISVTESSITLSDVTTNNVSTTKHGFTPKAPNDTTKFLRGDGTWATPSAGGLTKFTEAESTTSPNATVYVDSLTASGSSTNVDIAIKPKGTGSFMLAIPDGTSTGGNKRGTNSVDLQTSRGSNTQVASGNSSSILGGTSNTVSGNNSSILGGSSNTVSGDLCSALGYANNVNGGYGAFACGWTNIYSGNSGLVSGYNNNVSGGNSFVGGDSNTVSGGRSVVGGQGNNVSQVGSLIVGGYNTSSNNSVGYGFCSVLGYASTSSNATGKHVIGYGLNVTGDAQKSLMVLSKRTTDATLTELTVGGLSSQTFHRLSILDNSAYRFKGSIVGKKSGSTQVGCWDIDGLIVRGVGVATTTLVVSNVNVVSNLNGWGTPTLVADTSNGGLNINVQGLSATNIQWTCLIETTEVIYA